MVIKRLGSVNDAVLTAQKPEVRCTHAFACQDVLRGISEHGHPVTADPHGQYSEGCRIDARLAGAPLDGGMKKWLTIACSPLIYIMRN